MATAWSGSPVQSIKEEEVDEYNPARNDGDRAEVAARNKEVVAEPRGRDIRKRGRSKEVVAEPSGWRRSARSAGAAAKNDDRPHVLENSKFDQELRGELSLFLLGGSHPTTMVEEHGFRTMMRTACPQFKNVSRHTIRRDIMAIFERERKYFLESITSCPGRFSFTCENWKSEVTTFSFICITGHYIDATWKLNKRIILFRKLNPPYDGASIADEVYLCFREWKLDTKILCMTPDNSSYSDKMIDSLKTRLLPKGVLPLFGTFFQVRCFTQILNLVVQAGLELIDESVGKLRDGIQYIKASSNRMHEFYNAAETIYQLNVTRKLKADIPVRWNSTYKMLENALYFKDAFLWLAERDSIFMSNFWLSIDEWEKLSMMHSFLKTFYDVTRIFSETKHHISSLYLSCVYDVHRHLLEAYSARKNFMAPMLDEMKEKIYKYWSDHSMFLSCAAVLDPRFKMGFVRFCYQKLYAPDDAQRRIHEVRTTLQSLFEEYRVNQTSSDVAAPNTSEGVPQFLKEYQQYLETRQKQEEKFELDRYLDEPVRGIDENLDVLEFWSNSSMQYPVVASMARDVLAIPVSTVASESAFSLSRKVVSSNQSSLKPKTIEALMCLQDWYRWKTQEQEGAASSNATSHVEEVSSDSEYHIMEA